MADQESFSAVLCRARRAEQLHLQLSPSQGVMTLSGFSQQNRYITLTTPLGDGKLELLGFNGEEGISMPFRYQLDLLSSDFRA